MFTTAQAVAAGLHPDTLRARCDRGVLEPPSHGVYRYPGAPFSYADRVLAEILRLRQTAVAARATALYLWGLVRREPAEIQLTGRNRSKYRDAMVSEAKLGKDDVVRLAGVPITTVARTLLDVAALLSPQALTRAVGDAVTRGLTSEECLRHLAGGATGSLM